MSTMLSNLDFRRTRTAPTGYEKVRLLFHSIRTAQLLSSLISGSILIYFIWWLHHDHWATPWTFIVLTTVSILTIVFLAATIVFHFMTGLSPRVNLVLNSTLFTLWGMGFGMLAYWMSGTLTHYCDVLNWNDKTGIMVCRIYKALFTFVLLGFVSTIAALALDLHIYRLSTRFGRHMRLDNLDQKRRTDAARGPYTDNGANNDDIEGRNSEAFEVPQIGYGAQSAQNGAGYGQALGIKSMASDGYAVPEGQFEYDTVYHGGHEERAML